MISKCIVSTVNIWNNVMIYIRMFDVDVDNDIYNIDKLEH